MGDKSYNSSEMSKKPLSDLQDIIDKVRTLNPETMGFSDEQTRILVFNIIETLTNICLQQAEDIRILKDEINRLKGEKGRPRIKPNVPNKENDVPEQKVKKKWKKTSKNDKIEIDSIEIQSIDKNTLPPDAEFLGYRDVIIQDIELRRKNTKYRLARWYSKSNKQFYEADLPKGLQGSQFGPGLKAFAHLLYFGGNVTEPKIHTTLTDVGTKISKGEISNILTKDNREEFSKEKQEAYEKGMEYARTFGTDDTGGRHDGKNVKVHAITTMLITMFFIMNDKSRETVVAILNRSKTDWPKKIMISDDARQFWNVVFVHALCWIHEIRHYRKLNPVLDYHRKILRHFLSKLWVYYFRLAKYRISPNSDVKKKLDAEFDALFSTKTGYNDLDCRIEQTRNKKNRLLVVLDHPFVPLHNNGTESIMRLPVRKRDISNGTRSENGRVAWENMLSLKDTCRKLGISFYEYLQDRFSGSNKIQPLAKIIEEKAAKCT